MIPELCDYQSIQIGLQNNNQQIITNRKMRVLSNGITFLLS